MKILYFIFLLGLTTACATKPVRGQETWGGDSYALRFVKIGTMLAKEFQSDSKCKIASLVDSEKFNKLIFELEVTSVPDSRSDNKQTLYVNRYDWIPLSLDGKVELVLRKYLKSYGMTPNAIDSAVLDLGTCRGLVDWRKLSGLTTSRGHEERNSNLNVKEDVIRETQLLAKWIPEHDKANMWNGIDLDLLKSVIGNPRVEIYSESKPMIIEQTVFKDGLATMSVDQRAIRINKMTWQNISRGERIELLLHEFLGLLGGIDHHYQISAQLFLLLDEKLYRD